MSYRQLILLPDIWIRPWHFRLTRDRCKSVEVNFVDWRSELKMLVVCVRLDICQVEFEDFLRTADELFLKLRLGAFIFL